MQWSRVECSGAFQGVIKVQGFCFHLIIVIDLFYDCFIVTDFTPIVSWLQLFKMGRYTNLLNKYVKCSRNICDISCN